MELSLSDLKAIDDRTNNLVILQIKGIRIEFQKEIDELMKVIEAQDSRIGELDTEISNLVKTVAKFQQEYNSHEHWVHRDGQGEGTGQPKDQYRV